MYNCPKCGSPLTPESTSCPNCGEPVNISISPDTSMAMPNMATPVTPDAYTTPDMVAPVAPDAYATPGMAAPVTPDAYATPGMAAPVTPDAYVTPNMPTMPGAFDSNISSPMLPTEPKPPKPVGKIVLYSAIILVSLIAMGVMAFFMVNMFEQKDKDIEEVKIENSREYHFEGFYLYIPNELYAEVANDDFYVGDPEGTWSAVMSLGTGSYNTVVSNKSQLVEYYKQMGYEATEPQEREIGGTSFVKMEVMMGTKNVLVAYAKANGTQLFGIILENETLRPIGTIIASMNYLGPKFSLPAGLHFDEFKKTFEIAQ